MPKLLLLYVTIAIYLHIVIDALLPSDDDLMNNDDFTFQISRRGQNNAPLPGIRIPSRVVQNRGMRANMMFVVTYITTV